MLGSESPSDPNKKSVSQGINVPFVFFGAFGASVALLGSSVIAAEASFERTHTSFAERSKKAPELSLNPDGSVEIASAKHVLKPTVQQEFQPLHNQPLHNQPLPKQSDDDSPEPADDNLSEPAGEEAPGSETASEDLPEQEDNSWRVILNEDGTLSIVPADEVPEGATEVSCTAGGICTPVVELEADTTNAESTTMETEAGFEDSMSGESEIGTENSATENSATENSATENSTNTDTEADAEGAANAPAAEDNPLPNIYYS